MLSNCDAGENSLRVLWTTRRSNQSILKEINPENSLEGLKLKPQYFGHLMWRANALEKTLMLKKIESKRRRGRQRMRWLDSITDSMNMNLSKLWGIAEDREDWHAAAPGVPRHWTEHWATTMWISICTAQRLMTGLVKWIDFIPGSQHLPHGVIGWKKYMSGSCKSIPLIANAFYLFI